MTQLLLSLDTATDRPSFALGTPAEPGRDTLVAGRRELSREIEHVVARLLEARGAAPRELAGIVVADGPGSFTGLRIGIAFAKGLARALGVPLLAAPSLLGAARAALPDRGGTVVATYDALRGDVYTATYSFAGPLAPRRLPPDPVRVVAAPRLVQAVLAPRAGTHAADAFANQSHASAAALLALVGAPGGVSPVADPAGWEPAYGRPAEAEARYLARHGREGA